MPARPLPLLALLVLLTCTTAARADAPWRWHGAIGWSFDHHGTAVLSLGVERPWREFHDGRLHIDVSAYAFDARSRREPRLDRSVQALAAGLRWRRGDLVLGFSPALATARTDAISGSLQFVTTVGWQRRVGVLLQHMSNASTRGRNLGETMLMLEMRF